MAGVHYTPPQRLPVAARKYNKAQIREDDNLQRIQYAISAALRPLDVLTHTLLPLVPSKDVDRVCSTINDVRLLILNSAGVVNDQRTSIMLRAVNPEFQQPPSEGHYIMPVSAFQETLTQQSAMHQAMRDAQPKRPNQHWPPQQPNPPLPSQQFFWTGPSPGGGDRELKNHPGTIQIPKDNLLVNSLTPSKPLSVKTIASWLFHLTKMSTDVVPVPSIRSLASDLALSRGIPNEDVVTLGNWSSDSVLEFH